jgi:Uncharacterized membrane protein (homolog of Drosophila rhomboid)
MAYSTNNNGGFMGNIPIITRNILIINFLIWLACFVLKGRGFDLANVLGLHYFKADSFHFYQFITYMFTQEGFSHFFFNMFAVFMFGGTLERVLGAKRYILYYLVTGIGAGIVQELVWTYHFTSIGLPVMYYGLPVTIGASGSVFGLLLAFGMLFPNAPIYIMFIPIPIKAKWLVIGYGALELLMGFSNRAGDNVAHFAHLGGMLFGVFLILYWKKKGINNGRY